MMKRILCVLMAMSMLVLSACGASEDAKTMYELYMQANEKLSQADSLEMNMKVDMEMQYDGETVSMAISGLIKEVIKSETDIDMQMDLKMDLLGMSIDTSAFYKDGVYYINAMGEKSKEAMTLDEAMEQSGASSPLDFPKESIKNEVLTQVGDTKEITFTLDPATINDALIEQMGSLSGTIDTEANMVFGDVMVKIVLDKANQFKSFEMAFPMEFSAEGETITYDIEVGMEYLQIGGVTIDFPDDLDSYTTLAY